MRKFIAGALVATSASLLAGCGGGGEAHPTSTTVAAIARVGKDANQSPIIMDPNGTPEILRGNNIDTGRLGPASCLVLRGLGDLLGKRGSPAFTVYQERTGDRTAGVSGFTNVSGHDLSAAAIVLNDTLQADKVADGIGVARGFAAHSTTELAAQAIEQAGQTPPDAAAINNAQILVIGVLDQAREAVDNALTACMPTTFNGGNFVLTS